MASVGISDVKNEKTDYEKHYEDLYVVEDYDLKLWYQAKPYCFRVYLRGKNDALNFYLPISPSNMTITTHFATNVVATMYGTVEEHSEQRYFDIVLSGTTGMAPANYDIVRNSKGGGTNNDTSLWGKIKTVYSNTLSKSSTNTHGRKSYQVSKLNTGGFFNRTKALIENSVNKAVEVFDTSDDYESAISYKKTGYAAFHNFYRFLLAHKNEVLGEDNDFRWSKTKHPLRFINYKDNNQYNVAIRAFNLTRSAEDPLLYNYSIQMRGYKLSSIVDPEDITDFYDVRVANLGLDGVDSTSIAAELSNRAKSAKNAVSSVIAAAKGFGS